MKNKKLIICSIIVVTIICIASIVLILFNKKESDNILISIPNKEIKNDNMFEDITDETPILSDYYYGLMGWKSQINFTKNFGTFFAYKTKDIEESSFSIYVRPYESTYYVPEPIGFVKLDLSGIYADEFRKIIKESESSSLSQKLEEGQYTFIIIPGIYSIGTIDLQRLDYPKPNYNFDLGVPMEFLKLYYQDGEIINYNNQIYKKYNYYQLITLKGSEENDIIKIRILDHEQIRISDLMYEIVETFSSLEEVNQYLLSRGFNSI